MENFNRHLVIPLEGTPTAQHPNRRPLAEFLELMEKWIKLQKWEEALYYDTLEDGETINPDFDYDEDLNDEEKEIDDAAAYHIYMALSLETAHRVAELKTHAAPLFRRLQQVYV